MKEKANAILHLVSALYSGLFVVLAIYIAPLASVLRIPVRVPLIVGIAATILDASAAVVQWRKPPSGYILSIALHFAFAQAVVITTAWEYMQSESHSFVSWFISNRYPFVVALAFVRVIAGVSLLPATERRS
jgi:hypothetical protein